MDPEHAFPLDAEAARRVRAFRIQLMRARAVLRRPEVLHELQRMEDATDALVQEVDLAGAAVGRNLQVYSNPARGAEATEA
jgi:hypothetical protein